MPTSANWRRGAARDRFIRWGCDVDSVFAAFGRWLVFLARARTPKLSKKNTHCGSPSRRVPGIDLTRRATHRIASHRIVSHHTAHCNPTQIEVFAPGAGAAAKLSAQLAPVRQSHYYKIRAPLDLLVAEPFLSAHIRSGASRVVAGSEMRVRARLFCLNSS
jgi:hypothetical protein